MIDEMDLQSRNVGQTLLDQLMAETTAATRGPHLLAAAADTAMAIELEVSDAALAVRVVAVEAAGQVADHLCVRSAHLAASRATELALRVL